MSESVLGVRPTDVIPDAGQPVSDNHVEADEEDEHHRSVFYVSVDLSHYSAQSKQADNLKRAEERSNSLLLLMLLSCAN